MTRRARLLAALGATLLLGGATALLALRSRPRPPNIVLVVWDTCRGDRVAAMGYGKPTSPRLEALAAEGVRFTRCFTPSPWTPPAHASLFTGLLPSRHGLTVGEGTRIHPRVPTLARTLGDAGYETVGFSGNVHVSSTTGLDAGFEWFEPLYAGGGAKGNAARGVEAVAGWLEMRRGWKRPERPLFLFLNLMDTHIPRRPAPAALGPVLDPAVGAEDLAAAAALEGEDLLLHLIGHRRLAEGVLAGARTLYDGTVREVDEGTGRILDLLRGAGLLEDALVVVTADHGENLGEHGELDHRLSLYDPVLRVPLVLHGRGFTGGRTVDRQVRLQDLHPTILAAAGLKPPRATALDAEPLAPDLPRGRTLVAEFRRPLAYLPALRASRPDLPAALFDPFHLSLLAVRDPPDAPAPRKLIRFLRLSAEGDEVVERELLFDIVADPGETRDLLGPGATAGDLEAARRLARGRSHP